MLVTIEAEVSERSAQAQRQALAFFLRLGYSEPDEMVVREDSLVFLWLKPNITVFIDLEN